MSQETNFTKQRGFWFQFFTMLKHMPAGISIITVIVSLILSPIALIFAGGAYVYSLSSKQSPKESPPALL